MWINWNLQIIDPCSDYIKRLSFSYNKIINCADNDAASAICFVKFDNYLLLRIFSNACLHRSTLSIGFLPSYSIV